MMDILVGSGPSFVMRQGQREINHGCKVHAVDDQGEVMFLEKPAHRSLLEVAKVVVAHLKVCGVKEGDVSDIVFVRLEAAINRTGSVVRLTMALPELLREEKRDFLVEQFKSFLIQFWRNRVL
jgi:hypothetical protein